MADTEALATRLERANLWLIGLPRVVKRLILLVADGFVLPLLMYVGFAIRLGDLLPAMTAGDWLLLVLAPTIALPILSLAGFYRAVVRFISNEMAWTILGAVTTTTLVITAVVFMGRIGGVPRSVVLVFWALSLLYLGGSRFLARRYLVWALRGNSSRLPVAIYGAGEGGVQLAASLSQSADYLPKLFVDDNPRLRGGVVQGIRVIGHKQLDAALRHYGIDTVLVAMPGLSRRKRMAVVSFLESLAVRVKSVPALPDIVAGRARIEEIHDVDIADLLGRDLVPPDAQLLQASVTGRSVMVTGAGGSIGSELCRQIIAQQPKRLILFERTEYALYRTEQELRQWLVQQPFDVQLVSILGSVCGQACVEAVCRKHSVQTLFHAAAYKHVPIVEANVLAGVENNILGTVRTALAAEAAGVERFVLVSTDKAVRPVGVMGATKRFAEIALQALAQRGSATIFTMVRFGNVLGSSGSVVPLFRQQIVAGGPITLTHRDITRYFMTIAEAAQLVIQAGAMASGGEVFVLDMGEPVKIHDLARSMVQLMGFTIRSRDNPDGDIEIQVTGLRSGEKLHEELLIGTNSTGTPHSMVMQAHEQHPPWPQVQGVLQQLERGLKERNETDVLAQLRAHVHGYQPGVESRDPVARDNVVFLDNSRR